MKRDEILNMPAGREMNILIAEKVMGLEEVEGTDKVWWWIDGTMDELPWFSSHIGDAWKIIDKMRENPQVNDFCLWWAGDGYVCRFQVDTGYDVCDFSANALIAPLAICRAALIAVMED